MKKHQICKVLKALFCILLVLLILWTCTAIIFHFYPVSFLSYCIVPGLPKSVELWILGEPDGYRTSTDAIVEYELADGYILISWSTVNPLWFKVFENLAVDDPLWQIIDPFIIRYVDKTVVISKDISSS